MGTLLFGEEGFHISLINNGLDKFITLDEIKKLKLLHDILHFIRGIAGMLIKTKTTQSHSITQVMTLAIGCQHSIQLFLALARKTYTFRSGFLDIFQTIIYSRNGD